MELILAVLGAGPIGYFSKSRRRGLLIYLALWAVVFPIQSAIVGLFDDFDPLYFVVNAVILSVGIGLTRGGAALREPRRAGVAEATVTA
jgi:hypothetical protein